MRKHLWHLRNDGQQSSHAPKINWPGILSSLQQHWLKWQSRNKHQETNTLSTFSLLPFCSSRVTSEQILSFLSKCLFQYQSKHLQKNILHIKQQQQVSMKLFREWFGPREAYQLRVQHLKASWKRSAKKTHPHNNNLQPLGHFTPSAVLWCLM